METTYQVVLTEEGSVGPIMGWISETIGRHLSFSILLNHNRNDPAGECHKTLKESFPQIIPRTSPDTRSVRRRQRDVCSPPRSD